MLVLMFMLVLGMTGRYAVTVCMTRWSMRVRFFHIDDSFFLFILIVTRTNGGTNAAPDRTSNNSSLTPPYLGADRCAHTTTYRPTKYCTAIHCKCGCSEG